LSKPFNKIWTSLTAFGGYSYSATSDGETVNIRRGLGRGHTVIAKVRPLEWDDMLEGNGEPCFFQIERLATKGTRFAD
jgi:hypothetical protein